MEYEARGEVGRDERDGERRKRTEDRRQMTEVGVQRSEGSGQFRYMLLVIRKFCPCEL
jgi:hypothetical protein